MIDRGLKRAVFLTLVVVVVAKLASAAYDRFVDSSSDNIVANQEALVDHYSAEAQAQSQAKVAEANAARCLKIQTSRLCVAPKKFDGINICLERMRDASCDQSGIVNLCAAVEELQECGDDFADQKKNGCDKLRRTAQCDRKPAPDDREGLWMIALDDGLWDGED